MNPTPTVLSSPPTRTAQEVAQEKEDASLYLIGVGLLVVSLVLSGILGTLQERIFQTYGPHWRESVFYTVRKADLLVPFICQTNCYFYSTS